MKYVNSYYAAKNYDRRHVVRGYETHGLDFAASPEKRPNGVCVNDTFEEFYDKRKACTLANDEIVQHGKVKKRYFLEQVQSTTEKTAREALNTSYAEIVQQNKNFDIFKEFLSDEEVTDMVVEGLDLNMDLSAMYSSLQRLQVMETMKMSELADRVEQQGFDALQEQKTRKQFDSNLRFVIPQKNVNIEGFEGAGEGLPNIQGNGVTSKVPFICESALFQEAMTDVRDYNRRALKLFLFNTPEEEKKHWPSEDGGLSKKEDTLWSQCFSTIFAACARVVDSNGILEAFQYGHAFYLMFVSGLWETLLSLPSQIVLGVVVDLCSNGHQDALPITVKEDFFLALHFLCAKGSCTRLIDEYRKLDPGDSRRDRHELRGNIAKCRSKIEKMLIDKSYPLRMSGTQRSQGTTVARQPKTGAIG